MLRITDDDLMMFKYLMEENYIHIDDLKINLMNQKYDSDKRERLSKLKKEGYIKYKGDPISYKNYVFATQKAKTIYRMKFDEFKNETDRRSNSYIKFYEPEEYSIKNNYNLNSLQHDRMLTQLRFKLEEMGVDYWERETMYYNQYNKNPDAIFEIMGKKFLLELENSFKDEDRYEKIFIKYHKEEKLKYDYILYVTTKSNILDKLGQIIKKKYIAEIGTNKWKEKYRLSEFEDYIENNEMITYNIVKGEWKNINKQLKLYRESKW